MRLILIGFGVVGQNFAQLILSRSTELYNSFGIKPRVVACADKGGVVTSSEGLDLQRLLRTKRITNSVAHYDKNARDRNILEVIQEAEAEVVIELTPTNIKDGEPGRTHIISAMKAGKM